MAFAYQGQAFEQQFKYKEALACYMQCQNLIEKLPKNHTIGGLSALNMYLAIVKCYYNLNDDENAFKQVKAAHEHFPNDREVNRILGEYYMAKAKFKLALPFLLQVLACNPPKLFRVNQLLSTCYFSIGEPDMAEKYAKEAIKHECTEQERLELQSRVVFCCTRMNKTGEGWAMLNQMKIRNMPESFVSYCKRLKSRLLLQLGKPQESLAILHQLLEQKNIPEAELVELMEHSSYVNCALKDFPAMKIASTKLMKLAPQCITGHFHTMLSHLYLYEYEEALPIAKYLVKEYPTKCEGVVGGIAIVVCHCGMGSLDEAIKCMNVADPFGILDKIKIMIEQTKLVGAKAVYFPDMYNMFQSFYQSKSPGTLVCSYCKRLGNLKFCSGCKNDKYCSVECQKKHWPSHKAMCKQIAANK